MRRKTLRLLSCASVVALSSTIATSGAFAQTTVGVPAQIITNSAITLAQTQTMDFGTYVLIEDADAGDTTLVLDPVTTAITPTVDAGSTAIEVTAPATAGTITLQTPAAAAVNHWGTVSVDFPDAGLALGTLTYSLNGGATTALPAVTGTTINATGGVNDTLEYGGTLTVSATPADTTHAATVTINVAY